MVLRTKQTQLDENKINRDCLRNMLIGPCCFVKWNKNVTSCQKILFISRMDYTFFKLGELTKILLLCNPVHYESVCFFTSAYSMCIFNCLFSARLNTWALKKSLQSQRRDYFNSMNFTPCGVTFLILSSIETSVIFTRVNMRRTHMLSRSPRLYKHLQHSFSSVGRRLAK